MVRSGQLQSGSRGRHWWSAVLLIAFGLLLSAVVLEVGIRVWKRHVAFQPDPNLIRSLRVNVTRPIYSFDSPQVLESMRPAAAPVYLGMDYTNNVGLRMKEDVFPQRRDERRILFLGDSFTEAEQVPDDERFYSIVQRTLDAARNGARRWRVLNAGIQNGAPSQYVLQLRRYLAEFHPEVVIVFVAPNDVTDDFDFENRVGFERDAAGRPTRPRTRFQLWLLQRWWTLRYVDVAAQRKFGWLYDWLWPEQLHGHKRPSWWAMLCDDDPTSRQWFLRRTGPYITDLKQMSEAAGARFGVVLLHYMWVFPDEPFFEPGNPGVHEMAKQHGCLRSAGRPYREFMHAYLEKSDIAYSDSYDALRAAKVQQPHVKLWNFYDYHFSPAGHRVVADVVLGFLRQSFLDDGTQKP